MERILETERLYLREFVAEDAEMIFRLNSDADVMRYMPAHARASVSPSASADMVQHCMEYYLRRPGFGVWPTVLKDGGDCIGWTCLKNLDDTEEMEIGYRYFPQFWGRGLCTEICTALVRHGFEALNLDRVVGITHPENRASQRVLTKLGLQYERDAHYYGTDVLYYALQRQDFDSRAVEARF